MKHGFSIQILLMYFSDIYSGGAHSPVVTIKDKFQKVLKRKCYVMLCYDLRFDAILSFFLSLVDLSGISKLGHPRAGFIVLELDRVVGDVVVETPLVAKIDGRVVHLGKDIRVCDIA